MLKENLEFDFAVEAELNQVAPRGTSTIVSLENLPSHLQKIHESACHRARKYLLAEADLLDSIIQIDRDKIYQELGYPYLSHYCEKALGLSSEVSANFIRVARKSLEVPALQKAVSAGLSLTKAKTIVPVLKNENHEIWIEKAKTLSKNQLEKEIVRVKPSALKPEKAKPVGENRNRLEFELSDADLAQQRKAQDLVSQKLGKSASLSETQSFLLEFFLKHQDPVEKAKRAKIRAEKKKDRVLIKHETGLTKKQATWVFGKTKIGKKGRSDSEKRSRERSYRKAIPAHVQHTVHERDQGKCQERLSDGNSCHQTRWTELHHVIPKAFGGADTPENLVTLCSFHHRRRHLEN